MCSLSFSALPCALAKWLTLYLKKKKKRKKPTTTPANMWQATEKDVECILQIKKKKNWNEYYLFFAIKAQKWQILKKKLNKKKKKKTTTTPANM